MSRPAALTAESLKSTLERDFDNLAALTHEPTRRRTRKRHRPASGHARQHIPGRPLVRTPRCSTRICRRHNITKSVLAQFLFAFAQLPHIAETKNRPAHWRRSIQRPGFPAIARDGCARVIWIARIKIATADNSVRRITEIDSERSRAR